jgi:hypothetical protein
MRYLKPGVGAARRGLAVGCESHTVFVRAPRARYRGPSLEGDRVHAPLVRYLLQRGGHWSPRQLKRATPGGLPHPSSPPSCPSRAAQPCNSVCRPSATGGARGGGRFGVSPDVAPMVVELAWEGPRKGFLKKIGGTLADFDLAPVISFSGFGINCFLPESVNIFTLFTLLPRGERFFSEKCKTRRFPQFSAGFALFLLAGGVFFLRKSVKSSIFTFFCFCFFQKSHSG